jgi:hypothetical protein
MPKIAPRYTSAASGSLSISGTISRHSATIRVTERLNLKLKTVYLGVLILGGMRAVGISWPDVA